MAVHSSPCLDVLWQKGQDFLETEYAILGGAMTWVSHADLVSAISNAGGFGILACGSMSPDLLKQEIAKTLEKTPRNFGVNLITLHPQLLELIDVCNATPVRHIFLAGGIPSAEAIKRLKKADKKVICFAPTLGMCKKLIRNGADALIIEGSEAGGHVGPVSTSVLAQEILPYIQEIPIFVAGGIGRGEVIVNYLQMGAAGCQLGTRFVCAYESPAHPLFKKAFIQAQARDAVTSIQIDPRFPVIPVRALSNEAFRNFILYQQETIARFNRQEVSQTEAQLSIEHYWAGALRRAVIEGDITQGSLMAGQSVGMVEREQSTQEIIEELIMQAIHYLKKCRS